jgi:ketosteroid isomerase-like protein
MNRRTSILTGLSAATTLGALSSSAQEKDAQPANPELDKIRAVLKAHDDAMTNHNLEGVLAALSPKAVVMGTGPGEIWSGPEELKDAYTHFFADFDKGEQDFTYHVRMGELSSEMGWLFASGEVRGKKAGKEFAFPLNVSLTVSKATGAWKIAALHFSTLAADAEAK